MNCEFVNTCNIVVKNLKTQKILSFLRFMKLKNKVFVCMESQKAHNKKKSKFLFEKIKTLIWFSIAGRRFRYYS